MNKKSIFRKVCIGLIFSMLGASTFFASQSFAKYYEEYKNSQQAGVASPVCVYNRVALTRKQGTGFIPYPVSGTEDTLTITDIVPGDELYYYFAVKSNDVSLSNEVALKVTLSFKCYMVVLTHGADDSVITNYADFKVGETYNDPDQYNNKGYINFFKDMVGSLSSNYDDYKTGPFKNYDVKVDYNNTLLHASNVTMGSTNITQHSVGFYLKPAENTANGYLIIAKLPEQKFGTDNDEYIGARFIIDIDLTAEQVQSIPS